MLGRAHTPDQPDWRILSVQGAVLDQMGRHDEAQRYYATALRIVPDEPSVLSNLGLSYALSKDLVRAETTLRQAAAQSRVDPRVRQNLALVVGLQGRFAEAEGIARADLPSDEAAANVAYLRQMLAQQNGWKEPARPASPRSWHKEAEPRKRIASREGHLIPYTPYSPASLLHDVHVPHADRGGPEHDDNGSRHWRSWDPPAHPGMMLPCPRP